MVYENSKDLKKQYPPIAPSTVPVKTQEEITNGAGKFVKSDAEGKNFFRELFSLKKTFTVDDVVDIDPNVDVSDTIHAFTFVGDRLRVNNVGPSDYDISIPGEYNLQFAFPIEFNPGVEGISLILSRTNRSDGSIDDFVVYDIEKGTSHATLDEANNKITLSGNYDIVLKKRDGLSFYITYHNLTNANPGQVIFNKSGYWALYFVKPM